MADRCRGACAIVAMLSCAGLSQGKEFSTNAICQQYNCINPIFPGMEDLRRLSAVQLQCQPNHEAKQHMQFCKNAVWHDIAVPSPKTTAEASTLSSVVLAQDNAASTAYFYHLAGMNVDGWEHKHPDRSGNPCAQAVWKMVCDTYFPRAEAGCKQGEVTKHLRPCKNTCGSYIQACNVECCDESVQCVFSKEVSLLNGSVSTISGYHDALGPSAACTGASTRSASPGFAALFAAALALLCGRGGGGAAAAAAPSPPRPGWARHLAFCVALVVASAMLQGCAPARTLGYAFAHPSPAWKDKPNYWTEYQFIAPGAQAKDATVNSCDLNIPKREQCSGHGECRPWREDLQAAFGKPYRFCQCFRDWADPECRTKRKSQLTAYFISVFGGLFGFDQFYLGHYFLGFAKFATLGGLGFWWVFDIVRIGSAPVYANQYRLAYDLPHWAYVAFTVAFFAALGYFVYAIVLRAYKREKAKKNMLLQSENAIRKKLSKADHINPEDQVGNPTFASYPLPMPAVPAFSYNKLQHGQYGTVPQEVKLSGRDSAYSPWAVWNHAIQGHRPTAKYDSRLQPVDPAEFAALSKPPMPPGFYGY